MTSRCSVALLPLLAIAQGCLPHRASLVTLTCPPAASEPPAAPPKTAEPEVVDGPRVAPLAPLFSGRTQMLRDGAQRLPIVLQPFTLILNSRVVAVVPADADSAAVSAAFATLNPERIETLDVYTVPRAQQCYPAAIGTLFVATQR